MQTFLRRRYPSIGVTCALGLALALAPVGLRAQSAFAPPAGAIVRAVSGAPCYSGEIFLASHADTALLVPLGFSLFEFRGRSVRTVKYGAVWRTDADLSQLPASVSGVMYDQVAAATASEISSAEEWDVALRQASQPRGEAGSTIIRKYYVTPDGRYIPIERVSRDWESMPRYAASKRGFEDFDRDDLSSKGTFITSPSGKYPFTRAEDVGWSDPEITGTFHVMPVEKGVFHKPQNVGARDPETCGNFQVTPYSTLKDCGIGSTNWYKKPSGTGSVGFGPSNYKPSDGYLGIGYRSHPVSYPSQYRPSIRVRDSRR